MYVSHNYGRQYIDRRTDWRDVILPAALPPQAPGVQSMSYIIRGLDGGQSYEAKVLAKNKFGWSPMSDPFTFQTTEQGQYTLCTILSVSTCPSCNAFYGHFSLVFFFLLFY